MVRSFNGNGVSSRSLGKPAATFPGAVAGDAQLATAVDRLQTTLALLMAPGDTSMTVVSTAGIVPWVLLSIDNEIVQTTGYPTGNVVPIKRAFDGTTAATHLLGATVSGLIDAYHHNTLVAEIEAIETALGANLSKLPASIFTVSSAFVFPPQSPGGALTGGASPGVNNVITVAPVPAGVNGSDKSHYLWVSGGTGAAEAVLITGGSAVAGAASGTLIIQCLNNHSGAWTIQTATAGIQEAIQSLDTAGTGGTVYIPAGTQTIHATIMMDIGAPGLVTTVGLNGAGRGATMLTADLSVCPVIQIGTGNRGVPFSNTISNLTVTRVATAAPPANCIGIYWYYFNMCMVWNVEYSRHYIGEKITHPAGSICIGLHSDNCTMWGNTYCHVWVEHAAGVKYDRLYVGSAQETSSGSNTGGPTYAVVISADANDIKFNDCQFLCPVPWQNANAMQWGLLLSNMSVSSGMFIFSNCNWENLGKGIVTTDATCTGFNWLEFNGGRSGIDTSTYIFQPNAATTQIQEFFMENMTLSGMLPLTNPKWSKITGCFIGSTMTITGGDIVIANNIFVSQPKFTGAFRCLTLGPNAYVFNQASVIAPDFTGATGQIFVAYANATDAPNLFQPVSSNTEALGTGITSGAVPIAGNQFLLTGGGTVTTLTLPYAGFSGIVYIEISTATSFATGGNIATALSATAGQVVIAAYSKSQAKWYLK
jgi:hypothetical protein